MTIANFLTNVRYLINEATAFKWTDVELLTYAYNIICNDYYARLLASNNRFYDWYFDISWIAGTSTYDIPYPIIKEINRERIEKLDDDGVGDYNIPLLDPEEVNYVRSYEAVYLDEGGQSLTFTWEPTETGTVRLWFKRLPWEFHNGAPAADATAVGTTLKLDKTPTKSVYDAIRFDNDYYNGAWVQITADVGIGLKRRITDYSYDGTDAIITIADAWGTRYPKTTSTYEIIISLPEEFHELLAVDTAILARNKYDEAVGALQRRREQLYNTFFAQAGSRVGYRIFAED